MKKEDFLNEEFLKEFKSSEEFNSFMKTLYKRGIEKMLEGELDSHLGYDKHDKKKTSNSRNGYGKKTIKTEYGQTEINTPRDREASFEPVIVPKRSHFSQGIENVIISLYAKGMSNADIEDQISEVYNIQVSSSTISNVTDRITEDIVAWQNRPLDDVYMIVWLDGIVFKVRENSKVIHKTIYVAVGLNSNNV